MEAIGRHLPYGLSFQGTVIGFQTEQPWQWLFVAVALAVAVGLAVLAWARGRQPRRDAALLEAGLERVGTGMEELTRLPAWTSAGVGVGLWSLAVAVVGFEWDVAWHADNGRDKALFTVPHTLIVIGLFGIFAAAILAVVFATTAGARVGWRWRGLRVPYASLPLGLMGLGALIGFPLDAAWHATYGIDVTMWSPTHLLMIGGASLATLALWLLLAESGASRRGPARLLWALMGGVLLVGLSTFQLEYDMGIPQWQALYQPLLIAAATAVGLVAARAAIGAGGAVMAAAGFILLRGLLALLIGPGLGHTLPRFPLYLVEAALVELCFLALRRRPPVLAALGSGLLIGTVGVAAEWAWTHVWYVHPWQPSLVPYLWLALAIALAGGIVGVAVGAVLAGRSSGIPAWAVSACLVLMAGLLAVHLPSRTATPATVTLETATVGKTRLVPDRDGLMTVRRNVRLRLQVTPADAVSHADWFDVVAWQGHAPVVHVALRETGPGAYTADGLVPVGGDWKSLVFLARGDVVAGVPISMPPDYVYGLPGINAPHHRVARFVPASTLLMREFRGSLSPVAVIAFAAFGGFVLAWIVALGLAFRALAPPGVPRPQASRRLEVAAG